MINSKLSIVLFVDYFSVEFLIRSFCKSLEVHSFVVCARRLLSVSISRWTLLYQSLVYHLQWNARRAVERQSLLVAVIPWIVDIIVWLVNNTDEPPPSLCCRRFQSFNDDENVILCRGWRDDTWINYRVLIVVFPSVLFLEITQNLLGSGGFKFLNILWLGMASYETSNCRVRNVCRLSRTTVFSNLHTVSYWSSIVASFSRCLPAVRDREKERERDRMNDISDAVGGRRFAGARVVTQTICFLTECNYWLVGV